MRKVRRRSRTLEEALKNSEHPIAYLSGTSSSLLSRVSLSEALTGFESVDSRFRRCLVS